MSSEFFSKSTVDGGVEIQGVCVCHTRARHCSTLPEANGIGNGAARQARDPARSLALGFDQIYGLDEMAIG